jgi:hypothetical protein
MVATSPTVTVVTFPTPEATGAGKSTDRATAGGVAPPPPVVEGLPVVAESTIVEGVAVPALPPETPGAGTVTTHAIVVVVILPFP